MKKFTALALGLFLFCQMPVQAKKHKNGKNQGHQVKQQQQKKDKAKHPKSHQEERQQVFQSDDQERAKYYIKHWRQNRINNEEKRIFYRYYQELSYQPRYIYSRTLPPGLAKKVARGKGLPPGWQKKLAVGEVMPEEFFRHSKPVPYHIVEQLPPQPKGTCLVVNSGKVVRLLLGTMIIMDVFDL